MTALATTGLGSVGYLELAGVQLDGARRVGGDEVVGWLSTLGTLGRSAFQLGVLERGLAMTAEYAREREQFDKPIGSFQAVAQRLADGYIDKVITKYPTGYAVPLYDALSGKHTQIKTVVNQGQHSWARWWSTCCRCCCWSGCS
ncbi:Acyl-CoA dehydrogenase FadE27 [Mycobacterium talmoniae]|uniref:Acyl-CoA dehydrogenase FadE27 n=1 Tax=Mycobacterium talmoniae TaxID=1858794 RepID=A0A2S8BRI3_9MYCO|nr:Acyl-CoA dehydrogenase FadE27 [Mycobacterium talmoniae]